MRKPGKKVDNGCFFVDYEGKRHWVSDFVCCENVYCTTCRQWALMYYKTVQDRRGPLLEMCPACQARKAVR